MKNRSASLALIATLCLPNLAMAETFAVSDVSGLQAALGAVNPGDRIELAAGTYRIDGKLRLNRAGSPDAKIVMTSAPDADVTIEVNTVEGIAWSAPDWIVEGLHFKGVCADDSSCEHAIHIVGEAHDAEILGNVFQNFNAAIKGNGVEVDGARVWPNDVLVEGNEFFNDAPRNTSNPVTPVDVVGGRRWVVRANFIHDHAKGGGNKISYAAFLKGNSRDGVFERNLIVCELLHSGQIRLGLSFGGGGTGPDPICEDGTCNPEHQNGVMRNNIIANCPTDVGIYLNESTNTLIEHNTLFNTTGIDVRFDTSDAVLRNNILMGKIRERQDGKATASNNLDQVSAAQMRQWFVDPDALDFSLSDGAMIVGKASGSMLADDYCGARRDVMPDIGAIEYLTEDPCDTSSVPVWGVVSMPEPGESDMGTPGEPDMELPMPESDMGTPTPGSGDMGTGNAAPGNSEPGTGNAEPGADMSAGGDAADMGAQAPAPGPSDEDGVDEEGCAQASGRPGSSGGWGVGVLGLLLVGLRRRIKGTASRR